MSLSLLCASFIVQFLKRSLLILQANGFALPTSNFLQIVTFEKWEFERTLGNEMMKRGIDILISVSGLALLCIPMIGIALLIKITSKGPIIYWSTRVGRSDVSFDMPKFRTMNVGAPVVPTDELVGASNHITKTGNFCGNIV